MHFVGAVLALLAVASCNARTTDDKSGPSNQRFSWKTGGWGACYAPGGCGEGRRERQVWCAETDGRTVLQFHCEAQPEPNRAKPCFTACRHHRDKLQWQVSSWGPCLNVTPSEMQLNHSLGPREDHGVMQRNVTCVLLSHEPLKVLKPVDEENCFRVSRKPDPLRACHVPKPQDCIVGPFSDWSACHGCHPDNHTRVRVVLVAPRHAGRPCSELTETRACVLREECLRRNVNNTHKLPEYKLKLGSWRRCELPDSQTLPGLNVLSNAVSGPAATGGSSAESTENYLTYQPEVGYQTRDVLCGDTHGMVVDISLCLSEETTTSVLPSRIRPCIVPRDCVVSQWSAWARTQDGCVLPTEIRAEIHERKREVLRLPEGEGKSCPHMLETRQMTDKDQMPHCAHKYRWLVSKWSPCVVTSSRSGMTVVGCGGGVQLRDVACVTSQSSQPVEQTLCDALEPLPTVQRCEVACPRDCEVDGWQPWGMCRPMDCPMHDKQPGYRERHRYIRVAASERGLACPSLVEAQPCAQPSCTTWLLGQWGSCQLVSGTKKCGEGVRKRSIACTTLDGLVVDADLCRGSPLKIMDEEECWLPCPYDCVLSPWSDWSPCSHSCSSPSQVALQQRNRTIIAPHGPGGHSCPDPDQMLQIQPCNAHGCHGFSWLPLPWQPCIPSSSNTSSANNIPEYEGIEGGIVGEQKREVWCMANNDHQVVDHNCSPLPKPTMSQACVTVPRVDCQVSPWSDWSSCPNECVPDASSEVRDGEVAPTQTRHRVVVQWPSSDGMPCPSSEELRPCPLSAARCNHYLWGLGDWTDCQLSAGMECGKGYRTRGVWCYRNQRVARVSPGLCLDTLPEQQPAQWQTCYVDCQLPCVLSGWTPWTSCQQACQQRTRSRQLIGLWRSECASLPTSQSEPCPCERYSLVPLSDWSDCVLETDATSVSANGRPALGVCGAGSRYRAQACQDESNNIVEPSLCGLETGLMQEPCMVACSRDCAVSEWTAWGDCSAFCGPGTHNRSRQALAAPQSGGRPCGELQQLQTCSQPCDAYTWEVGGWSDCQLIPAHATRGCGTGDQYRSVRCVENEVEVSDAHCDLSTQPADINACHVACPGDCVLGPWSDWSLCPQPCDPSKERQRTRSVLRSAANPGSSCPPLIEVQACQLNATCFSYTWEATVWSSCLPLGGSPCGEGVENRVVFCRRSDGMPADDSLCEGETRPTLIDKWCYVDCPVDCELSHWSQWNNTACQCGQHDDAQVTRHRHVVTSPSQLGRPCAETLIQERPCPVSLCYSWMAGPWGECQLQGAWCGHGLVSRNVTCLVVGSERQVEGGLCDGEVSAVEDCYVPCSGDCHVAEWSRWSHCHRDCHGSDLSGGYQTRSRAVLRAASPQGEACPTALWETRPCFTGPCLTFDWSHTQDGTLECQRSDGIFVIGGCDTKPKPCEGPSCGCSGDTACKEEEPSTVGTSVLPDDEIQSLLYYPRDDEVNVWMFAMIGIAAVFIVFAAISSFLLCRGGLNGNLGCAPSNAQTTAKA